MPKELLGNTEKTFPLEVVYCKSCAHLQLSHVVSPEVLFRNYVYVSGTSSVMVQHLREYAEQAIQMINLRANDFVFEFGSNDGTLLRHFKDAGITNVLGMDPAKNIADAATASGLDTIPDFFCAETAINVRIQHGQAKLICANHCCAHIDDFHGVVAGVKELLAPDGVWIFEVGYLLTVFTRSLFDTIYHEHVDFHSVEPIRKFCAVSGLKLLNATSNSIQGGSLRCFVGWPDTSPSIEMGPQNVTNLIREEVAAGLHLESTFLRWVRFCSYILPSFIWPSFLSKFHRVHS